LIVAAIPAYNEEKTIAKVVVRAMKYVDRVVVVDDGSTDDTATIAEHLGADLVRHEGKRSWTLRAVFVRTLARRSNRSECMREEWESLSRFRSEAAMPV
jgi:glycosyltransferase involved in cell wall biosynthesis